MDMDTEKELKKDEMLGESHREERKGWKLYRRKDSSGKIPPSI